MFTPFYMSPARRWSILVRIAQKSTVLPFRLLPHPATHTQRARPEALMKKSYSPPMAL